MNKLSLAVLLLLAPDAYATVDMQNGNYTESWTDVALGGAGIELKVERTYNSRAAFDGMFGYGWCSDFETRLDFPADGSLKAIECGAGREVLYVAEDRAGSGETAKRYHAHGMEFDNIVYESGRYVRTIPGGYREFYDRGGRRIRVEDGKGNYQQYFYDNDRLRRVQRNDGGEIVFSYDGSGKVTTAGVTGQAQVSYRHEGADLLAVSNAWGNTFTYRYDQRHKLERVKWPDERFISLQYDAAHDWVSAFTDRAGCRETYEYLDSADDPKNHYFTNLSKVCNGEKVDAGKFEFWRQRNASGELFLSRVRSERGLDEPAAEGGDPAAGKRVRDIRYHETFRLPVFLAKNGDENHYEYYPNGQVKSRSSQYVTVSFAYAGEKVSEVVTRAVDDEGKEISRHRSQFSYDAKGNMITANSDDIKLRLGYNAEGLIISLRDNRRHDLRIRYDRRCAKPALITGKKDGSITVSYNSACEIDKVNSKKGPAMAMRVAGLFNNLLEVVAPATMELYE